MITNEQSRAQRIAEWAAVRKLCDNAQRLHIVGAAYFSSSAPEGYFNLPLVLAYAVLDQVLADLISQEMFSCEGRMPPLGKKMSSSKAHVPWQDYATVEAGRNARNGIAHDAILVSEPDCRAYIAAIESELTAWCVLERGT